MNKVYLKRINDDMNVPNILSILRIILIPVFAFIYLSADKKVDNTMYYISAFILLISGFTDFLDGVIARKYNLITSLGKILDPLADKLTQAVVCICLALKINGFFYLVILFFIKEILMLIGGVRIIKKSKQVEGSKWFGKLSTFVFYVVVMIVIIFPDLPSYAVLSLIGISAACMIFAFLMYILVYRNISKTILEKNNKSIIDSTLTTDI